MGHSQILQKRRQKKNSHPPRATGKCTMDWYSSIQDTIRNPNQAPVIRRHTIATQIKHKPVVPRPRCPHTQHPSRWTKIFSKLKNAWYVHNPSVRHASEAPEIRKPHHNSRKHPPTNHRRTQRPSHPVKTPYHGKNRQKQRPMTNAEDKSG